MYTGLRPVTLAAKPLINANKRTQNKNETEGQTNPMSSKAL